MDVMPTYVVAVAATVGGVLLVRAALAYRAGRHPEWGRNRTAPHAGILRRNAVFMFLPLGVACLGLGGGQAGILLGQTWVAALGVLSSVASLFVSYVCALRPPHWLVPKDPPAPFKAPPPGRLAAPVVIGVLAATVPTTIDYLKDFPDPGFEHPLTQHDYAVMAVILVVVTPLAWAARTWRRKHEPD